MRRLDPAVMVMVFVFLAFYAAVIASMVSGAAWVGAVLISVGFFVTAVLWLYHGLVAPKGDR